jgi:hypothetical protein
MESLSKTSPWISYPRSVHGERIESPSHFLEVGDPQFDGVSVKTSPWILDPCNRSGVRIETPSPVTRRVTRMPRQSDNGALPCICRGVFSETTLKNKVLCSRPRRQPSSNNKVLIIRRQGYAGIR